MRILPTTLAFSTALFFALACGSGGPASPEEAQVMCAAGEIEGCHYLATLFTEVDNPAEQEHPEAFEFYADKMCKDGDANWCSAIGHIRLTGEGGTKDFGEARSAFQTSCDADNAHDCFQLAVMLIRGESDDGSDGDAGASVKVFEKACELENFDACIEAWKIYDSEESGAPDPEKAKVMKEKGCKLQPDAPGCE